MFFLESVLTKLEGDGIGKMRDGLGVISGGLWGKGVKLGSIHQVSFKFKNDSNLTLLFQLIVSSNPSPRLAYFDERSSFDRLRLTSTRVLGHGLIDPDTSPAESTDEPDDSPMSNSRGTKARRHILVTGGFGSLGKHIVKDMLLGVGTDTGASARGSNEWDLNAPSTSDDDVFITLLDVVDRSSELEYLLQSAPLETPMRVKGTDPRASAFTSSERSVGAFRRSGKLRVIVGDVRDKVLMAQLLAPGVSVANSGKSRRPKAKGGESGVVPPVSGIVHLAAYSPSDCKLNPIDCVDVETGGMEAILLGLTREGLESSNVDGLDARRTSVVERPWLVVPRRAPGWDDVSSIPLIRRPILIYSRSSRTPTM